MEVSAEGAMGVEAEEEERGGTEEMEEGKVVNTAQHSRSCPPGQNQLLQLLSRRCNSSNWPDLWP